MMSQQGGASVADGQQPSSPQAWTLFVGQITNEVNEETLRTLFASYGPVTEAKILFDRTTQKPRGCGFVTYADRQSAETAIATLHDKYTLPGSARPLIVRYSTKQLAADRPDPGPFKLYVSNLSKLTTAAEVRALFAPYGQLVDDVVILQDQVTGQSKGVAFVRYNTRAEALMAIQALHEQLRDKDAVHLLQVKFAHSPGEKQRMMNGLVQGPPGGPARMGGAAGSYYPAPYGAYGAHQGGYTPYSPHGAGAGYHAIGQHAAHPAGAAGASAGRAPVAKGPEGANLFVYGIPEAYNDDNLLSLFAPFGTVVNAKVYRDLATGKSKGFGFVSFDNVPAAQQACQQLNGYVIQGRKLTVKPKTDGNMNPGVGAPGTAASSSATSAGMHPAAPQGQYYPHVAPHSLHHAQPHGHHTPPHLAHMHAQMAHAHPQTHQQLQYYMQIQQQQAAAMQQHQQQQAAAAQQLKQQQMQSNGQVQPSQSPQPGQPQRNGSPPQQAGSAYPSFS